VLRSRNHSAQGGSFAFFSLSLPAVGPRFGKEMRRKAMSSAVASPIHHFNLSFLFVLSFFAER